jgi:hypothetical protein
MALTPANEAATLCHTNGQKRQFALSREVIENKGTRKPVLHFQSREVIENKVSYKNPYELEMAKTLCRAKGIHAGQATRNERGEGVTSQNVGVSPWRGGRVAGSHSARRM